MLSHIEVKVSVCVKGLKLLVPFGGETRKELMHEHFYMFKVCNRALNSKSKVTLCGVCSTFCIVQVKVIYRRLCDWMTNGQKSKTMRPTHTRNKYYGIGSVTLLNPE